MKEDLRSKIIAKAWKDEAFRKELLANPKAALKKAFGIDIPKDVQFDVLQEDAKHLYFTLPLPPSNVREMTETELNKMAGTNTLPNCPTATACITGNCCNTWPLC